MIGFRNAEQLRVAIASTQPLWHGGEKQAALLAHGLRQRGGEVYILARAGGQFAIRMKSDGFRVLEFEGRGRSPRAIWNVRRAIKKIRPHILHANDSHSLTATGFGSIGLRTPLHVAARRVDFPLRSAMRYDALCDGLLCVSRAVADICAAAGLNKQKLPVVHDGVDPSFARSGSRDRGRRSLNLDAEHRLLLTVAKLTDHKGHIYFLRALPRILRRFPQVRVAFAGDGELREELAREARQLGLHHHVLFLGYRDDIADLLAAADVVVQPSHMEGLCSSLIDAMLARNAIVATAAGGIPDLLEVGADNPVGWLVPPKSPIALADAIIHAIGAPEESAARACAAEARALAHFTADAMVDKTLDAYRFLARRRYGNQAASKLPMDSLESIIGETSRGRSAA